MVAAYPSSIAVFPTHHDLTDIIDAADPNNIQTELVAVENALGIGINVSTTPSSAGSFTNTSTTYSNLAARLANIETGIVADTHTQYVKNSAYTAKGAILVGQTAGNPATLPVGPNGSYLAADNTQPNGVGWETVTQLALDTSAADIQPVGTLPAAGSTGKAADAGHLHSEGLSGVLTWMSL